MLLHLYCKSVNCACNWLSPVLYLARKAQFSLTTQLTAIRFPLLHPIALYFFIVLSFCPSITNYHRLGSLKQQKLFPDGLGARSLKKLQAGAFPSLSRFVVAPGNPQLWLQLQSQCLWVGHHRQGSLYTIGMYFSNVVLEAGKSKIREP